MKGHQPHSMREAAARFSMKGHAPADIAKMMYGQYPSDRVLMSQEIEFEDRCRFQRGKEISRLGHPIAQKEREIEALTESLSRHEALAEESIESISERTRKD